MWVAEAVGAYLKMCLHLVITVASYSYFCEVCRSNVHC